jgi:hypothetical protein
MAIQDLTTDRRRMVGMLSSLVNSCEPVGARITGQCQHHDAFLKNDVKQATLSADAH